MEDGMIKDIVVHLTGSDEDKVRLAYADQVARLFQAHVTGLQVHALPDFTGYTELSGAPLIQDFVTQSFVEAEAAGERLKPLLSAFEFGGELRRLDLMPGLVGRTLAAEARTADLFIGTRPYGDPTGEERVEEQVLLGSGRGCLFLPPGGTPPKSYGAVLVAWNDSREAARAVAAALPFLKKAQEVVVAIIEEGGAGEERHIEAGADIGRYLSRHGVSAEIRKIAGWSHAGDALLNEAARFDADLVVMGGYGHSRFRQFVLGGATRLLLSKAETPVLMAH
jgi:nucleotide-binding universal stress UspA family protein